MGLCIGASLMSFVELIDLVVSLIYFGFGSKVSDTRDKVPEKSIIDERIDKLSASINILTDKVISLEKRVTKL